VKDYEAFIKKERDRNWPKPDFRQNDDHPAVYVSLEDAEAFCIWLTEKEQKEGRLGKEQLYRLPSDHEWSCAVGVATLEDAEMSPSLKKYRNMEVYPWGNDFPPPAKSGNFYGEECEKNPFQTGRVPIEGYNDDFDRTAPVGSFKENEFGLYDLEGNVYEWCQSWYDPTKKANQVWRGGAWLLSKSSHLMSASRAGGKKEFQSPALGFRIVLDAGSGGGQATVEASSVKPVFKTSEATKETPFQNKLGMRFVPVPIIGGASDGQRVLFSIWETRMKDYEAFIEESSDIHWPKLPYAVTKEDPAGYTSWDNAMSFSAWLTERGRKNGELSEKQEYRLPTDHEWSCAVGLGGMEDAEASPVSKNKNIPNEFPWGKGYPPPKGAGNFSGEEGAGVLPRQPITGYDDGFIYTSPAGTYTVNKYGLYDLGGNVWEWVQDWFNPKQKQKRVFRGAAYIWETEPALLSSNRGLSEPGKQIQMVGFRVVIAPVE
ncbi:MAG: SUMF1/EgtB/PvdO family nonheme iron enzyme, partial [Verrucomicrobiota bacterium]